MAFDRQRLPWQAPRQVGYRYVKQAHRDLALYGTWEPNLTMDVGDVCELFPALRINPTGMTLESWGMTMPPVCKQDAPADVLHTDSTMDAKVAGEAATTDMVEGKALGELRGKVTFSLTRDIGIVMQLDGGTRRMIKDRTALFEALKQQAIADPGFWTSANYVVIVETRRVESGAVEHKIKKGATVTALLKATAGAGAPAAGLPPGDVKGDVKYGPAVLIGSNRKLPAKATPLYDMIWWKRPYVDLNLPHRIRDGQGNKVWVRNRKRSPSKAAPEQLRKVAASDIFGRVTPEELVAEDAELRGQVLRQLAKGTLTAGGALLAAKRALSRDDEARRISR